jgi:hypothetical protein
MPSKPYPHPEERPKGASRRTQARYAALRVNSCSASQLNLSYKDTTGNGVESSECIYALASDEASSMAASRSIFPEAY